MTQNQNSLIHVQKLIYALCEVRTNIVRRFDFQFWYETDRKLQLHSSIFRLIEFLGILIFIMIFMESGQWYLVVWIHSEHQYIEFYESSRKTLTFPQHDKKFLKWNFKKFSFLVPMQSIKRQNTQKITLMP